MKIHCEGFTGWFQTCPVPGPTLEPGQLLTASQATTLTHVGVVLIAVIIALIMIGAIATIAE